MDRCAVERALKWIEENLTDDEALSNAALARAAGYSEFHFIRMFREAVRLTPADYVRKRRISEIVRAAACGIPFMIPKARSPACSWFASPIMAVVPPPQIMPLRLPKMFPRRISERLRRIACGRPASA